MLSAKCQINVRLTEPEARQLVELAACARQSPTSLAADFVRSALKEQDRAHEQKTLQPALVGQEQEP